MTESGEVRYGDALIRYRVVRSPRRHKTIEVTVDEPGLVTVSAPVATPTERLEATVRRRRGLDRPAQWSGRVRADGAQVRERRVASVPGATCTLHRPANRR